MTTVWLNGELVEAAQARVSVLDRGLLNGYGLFETMRAYRGRPWAFDELRTVTRRIVGDRSRVAARPGHPSRDL